MTHTGSGCIDAGFIFQVNYQCGGAAYQVSVYKVGVVQVQIDLRSFIVVRRLIINAVEYDIID
ncbi:MAG: hypothetical protein GVY08_11310 [Bacteroidetes bacterium]|jgi:hypothetical protein|nr:hypothetical protein [Bacteroidota bacterium]